MLFEGKYLTPPPSPYENLVSDSSSVALRNVAPRPPKTKGRSFASRLRSDGGVPLHLHHRHREDIGGTGLITPKRRALLHPQHLTAPARREQVPFANPR